MALHKASEWCNLVKAVSACIGVWVHLGKGARLTLSLHLPSGLLVVDSFSKAVTIPYMTRGGRESRVTFDPDLPASASLSICSKLQSTSIVWSTRFLVRCTSKSSSDHKAGNSSILFRSCSPPITSFIFGSEEKLFVHFFACQAPTVPSFLCPALCSPRVADIRSQTVISGK